MIVSDRAGCVPSYHNSQVVCPNLNPLFGIDHYPAMFGINWYQKLVTVRARPWTILIDQVDLPNRAVSRLGLGFGHGFPLHQETKNREQICVLVELSSLFFIPPDQFSVLTRWRDISRLKNKLTNREVGQSHSVLY